MKKITLLASLFSLGALLHVTQTEAQISSISNFNSIYSIASNDYNTLVSGYFAPFGDAFCANLSNGWYNTAKTHRKLGFDIKIDFNGTLIPTSAKTFDISGLNHAQNANGLAVTTSQNTTQTVAGAKSDNATITYTQKVGSYTSSFNVKIPQGIGLGFLPAPTVQVGLGLLFNTDLMVRFIPKYNFKNLNKNLDFSVYMFGVGLRHSLSQYIPVFGRLRIVNLSAVVGYSRFGIDIPLNVKPSTYKDALGNAMIPTTDDSYAKATSGVYNNQKSQLVFNAVTADLVASVDIPFVAIWVSGGINPSQANYKTSGTYPIPVIDAASSATSGKVVYKSTDINSSSDIRIDTKGIKPHAAIGAKLKLGLLEMGGSYSLAQNGYRMFNANLSISFR